MRNNKRRFIILLAFFAMSAILISYTISKKGLKITSYTLRDELIITPVRIVQLTDLHNSLFGKNNRRLIRAVREERPDLIFLTGDLLNQKDANIQIAIDLITALKDIAPVYCSLGNHEIGYEAAFGTDIREQYKNAGAEILDYEWRDLDFQQTKLRIGGIYGYCLPEKYVETGEANPNEAQFLNEMTDTDRYCILLAHLPLCWLKNGSLEDYEVNLVFSGHVHGGQVRLPFIGGLYAPDQGWFVGREWGIFSNFEDTKHIVLSTGLGSNEIIPRFNNVPEVVSITLLSD